MAVTTINIAEQNTAPPYQFTLERNGVVIDVTDCTVNLILAKGSTITNDGHQECEIITATAGIVQYTPQTGDFPSPGSYIADVQIVYPDTSEEVLYDQLKFKARKIIGG